MFQNRAEQSEEDFNQLIKIFDKDIFTTTDMDNDTTEWDMNKTYSPNYACIWNSPRAINKKCRVMQKNSQVALVQFVEPVKGIKSIAGCIYRLEDLSIAL